MGQAARNGNARRPNRSAYGDALPFCSGSPMKQQKNTDGSIVERSAANWHPRNPETAQQRMRRATDAFTRAAEAVRHRQPGAVKICGKATKELNEAREQLRAASCVKGPA